MRRFENWKGMFAGNSTDTPVGVGYTFLGTADHESHKGERPIAFVWKLRRSMPADFFRGAKVATA